jgi:hypothetical protein
MLSRLVEVLCALKPGVLKAVMLAGILTFVAAESWVGHQMAVI